MSKASQIVILCEDRAHELFARRFLIESPPKSLVAACAEFDRIRGAL